MNLIVDIGNTLVKLAVFADGRLVAQRSVGQLHPGLFDDLRAEAAQEVGAQGADGADGAVPGRFARAIVSSTRGAVDGIVAEVARQCDAVLEFTPATPVPIGNAYRTPETLGRDRLAAAVGAVELFPGRNVLIVDFGTAVTLDLVSADGIYRGGCISPGMQLRFKSLHDYTARLPLCGPTETEGLQGATTQEAVQWGVMNSLSFEIEGYIGRLRSEFADLCVIFTGGDAKFFVKRIKNTIFASCNLVLAGLNRILEYNASEEPFD